MLTKHQKNVVTGIGVALIAVVFYSVLATPLFTYAREHDFMSFMIGPQMVLSGQSAALYSMDRQQEVARRLAPAAPVFVPFNRPPFYALVLIPFGCIDFRSAWIVWLAIQIAAAFLIWAWAWRRFGPESLVLCALFPPVARAIMHGQDTVVIALIILAVFMAMERENDALAGALAGLLLIKFHLYLLLPLAMVLQRRWRMFAAYAFTAVIEMALSVWLISWSGMIGYLRHITRTDIDTISPSLDMMVNLHAVAVGFGLDVPWLKVLLGLGVCALVVMGVRRPGAPHWFWIAITGSMLLPPHTYIYDLAFIAIPAMLVYFEQANKPLRVVAVILLTPVPYLFTYFGRPLSVIPALLVMAFLALLVRQHIQNEPNVVKQ